MTTEDIAIFSDVDEVFARDFLLAAMTCDVPLFRKGQDCQKPKVMGRGLTFQSSAECIMVSGRPWYHPDMIIGECMETVGDQSAHAESLREVDVGGSRGYGMQDTW